MPRNANIAPGVLDDVALACDISITPDPVHRIDGFLFVRNPPAPSDARAGMGAVTITRHDDGAVAMELARYEAETRAFTDQRAIPIGETTYEALAEALFEPKGEPITRPLPVVVEAVVVSTGDGEHRNFNHQIREEIGDDGRVTLTVTGLGGGETRTVSLFDPAVASYIDRRLALMEETVARQDMADRTGIAAAEPIPLGAGRPDLSASGKMSYRLSWAYRADASPRFSVEIAGGVTRVTITGEDGRPSVVSSTSWEVERHWRRLLYAGIVADQPEWWVRAVQGRRPDETPDVVSPPPPAEPTRTPRPLGMSRFSPTPRRRYPRIRMEGGALLGVRRGKGREFTYAPKLEITVEDGHVCAFVGLDDRPVMSNHPAVVAFFESFDEALRRDKSRQRREQTPA